MKKLLFTFAIILVTSFAASAQKGDDKPPPKPKPPVIVVPEKPKPTPQPKPEKPSFVLYTKTENE
jgi:hypothetical protein